MFEFHATYSGIYTVFPCTQSSKVRVQQAKRRALAILNPVTIK